MLLVASEPSNRNALRRVSQGPVEWSPDQIARILPSGEDVLFITFTIEQWLQKAPGGPLEIDDERAREAIQALAEGWSAKIPHALVAGPRTATALEREAEEIGPAGVRRLLAAMTAAGLHESPPGGGRDKNRRYAATDFLRAGIAPLVAGARFEHRWAPAQTPHIDPSDVEAAFGLALPLLRLRPDLSGVCRLLVSVVVHGESVPAGAMVRVERGRVAAISTELAEEWDALLEGPTTAWFDAVIEPRASRLLPEGDENLAAAVLTGLHEALFSVPVS